MLKSLIILSVFACGVLGQANPPPPNFDRTCDERFDFMTPFVKDSFSVAAYSGVWFEVQRYQQEEEPVSDCMSSSYTWLFLSNQFNIRRTGFLLDENRAVFSRDANALLAFPDESPRRGLLNVTYYDNHRANNTNYFVLGTDYYNYMVGWGCEDFEDGTSREFAWVNSRLPELPTEFDERVNGYVEQFLDANLLRTTEQSDDICFGDGEGEEVRKIRAQYAKQKKMKLQK